MKTQSLFHRILVRFGLRSETQKRLDTRSFQGRSTREVFTLIHDLNYWNSPESVSGRGSEVDQAAAVVEALPKLFREYAITTVLDLPCGDFNWMSHVDLRGVKYIGADIVPALVQATAERFAHRPELRFLVVDLLADKLPPSDLVMVRDCLVHLSFADIHSAFNNLKASGARYLLTTTFTQLQENRDIVTGDWRPINLQQAPFNLPTPLVVIDEKCLDANGAYRDKSLALWELRNV